MSTERFDSFRRHVAKHSSRKNKNRGDLSGCYIFLLILIGLTGVGLLVITSPFIAQLLHIKFK